MENTQGQEGQEVVVTGAQTIITETGAEYQLPEGTEILAVEDSKSEDTTPVVATEAKAPKEKKAKWFEAEGAFPYKAGDVIEIIAGDILIGRKAEVVKPSAKQDALKCILFNKDGELQKCTITMDFVKIQLAPTVVEAAPAEEVTEEVAV